MNTRIVYTLISDETDSYLEQALMSVYSLRKYHPDSMVDLVVDSRTEATLEGKRGKIKEYVTTIVPVEVPEQFDKKSRSRYLKTNLRQLIHGDYLFVDCDTVICGRLDGIDNIEGDMAAASDVNGPLPLTDEYVVARCEAAGFLGLKSQPYFNSGVMLVRDTPQTHQFYERWYANWQASASKGVTFDQPALCQTNVEMGLPIRELSGEWNCQFKYRQGYAYLRKALIMHYFNGNGSNQWTYPSDVLFKSIKNKGAIDSTIDKLLCNPKSQLYTVMTINEDDAYRFFNSEMIDVFYNNRPLYRFVTVLARFLNHPVKRLSQLKSVLKA